MPQSYLVVTKLRCIVYKPPGYNTAEMCQYEPSMNPSKFEVFYTRWVGVGFVFTRLLAQGNLVEGRIR